LYQKVPSTITTAPGIKYCSLFGKTGERRPRLILHYCTADFHTLSQRNADYTNLHPQDKNIPFTKFSPSRKFAARLERSLSSHRLACPPGTWKRVKSLKKYYIRRPYKAC
jgi:hypothetical protein